MKAIWYLLCSQMYTSNREYNTYSSFSYRLCYNCEVRLRGTPTSFFRQKAAARFLINSWLLLLDLDSGTLAKLKLSLALRPRDSKFLTESWNLGISMML